jgi:hypothetical protein
MYMQDARKERIKLLGRKVGGRWRGAEGAGGLGGWAARGLRHGRHRSRWGLRCGCAPVAVAVPGCYLQAGMGPDSLAQPTLMVMVETRSQAARQLQLQLCEPSAQLL